MENRCVRATCGNFATREEGGEKRIEGYFAVFGDVYEIAPGLTESVAPSAFDGIEGTDIRALINHDTSLVLGRTAAGTPTLRVDTHGLYGSILINPDDTDAMNVYSRVKRGDVSQCSFGFEIENEDSEYHDGAVHWTLRKVKLYEVSVVTFPAYTATNVSARQADFENIIRRRNDEWRLKMRNRLEEIRCSEH